jgi:hypothetical protein
VTTILSSVAEFEEKWRCKIHLSLKGKAELVMAIEDYEREEMERGENWVDIVASDGKSNDKILLRIITEPKSKSGFVGVDAVGKMIETMKDEDYDKGILISKRFTKAAKRKTGHEGIQIISEKFMPRFKPEELFFTIQHCTDILCKAKCSRIPKKESDCKGYSDGCYSCKIRLISDNASFHFERGWTHLLQNDLIQLLTAQHSAEN